MAVVWRCNEIPLLSPVPLGKGHRKIKEKIRSRERPALFNTSGWYVMGRDGLYRVPKNPPYSFFLCVGGYTRRSGRVRWILRWLGWLIYTHTHTLKKSLSIFSILYIQSSSSLDIFWPFLYSDRHRQHMRLIYIHRIFKKCGGLREKNRGGWKKSMKMLPIPDESWISHSVFLFSFKGAMSWWKIRK